MKKRFWIFPVLAVLFAGLQGARADSTTLYVRNRLYTKPLYWSGKTLYAAADDIFPAVELEMKAQGRVLCGATPNYRGPICPENAADSFLYIDGRPITAGALVRHEKVWISIPVLAKAVGYGFQYNKATGIADLFFLASPVYAAPKEAASSKPSSGSSEKSKKKKNPVVAQNLSLYQDTTTYEIRVNFDVANVSKDAVNGITATLRYLDGNGNPIVTRDFTIGTLPPGGSAHENDYWINSTRIYVVKPDVQLDWQGKEKE